ncbi:MAG TPA: hypothetical protein PL168_05220 [Methanobacterium sp.]|jgi:hypothetical protein|nr:hypothetical protein [Methanobacterium sp.]HOI40112.1 hypothetical protein [Methanobacterium sp.]
MTETSGDGNNQEKIKDFLKKIFEEKDVSKSEFIVAIIGNIIILYIVNNLLSWNLSFITSSFQDVLWIFNISICATIIVNLIFLAYHPGWFRSLVKIILNILSFLVCYYLYTIFPFIFSQAAYTIILKIILIFGMVALIIASLIEVLRLIFKVIKS